MILIDTHVWIWWVETPHRLSASLQAAIATAETEDAILVSVASIWEIALKSASRRLQLSADINSWVERASSYPGVSVESIGSADVIASTQLAGPLHRDPFDRLLVAMSRRLGVPLATTDRLLVAYPHVTTID